MARMTTLIGGPLSFGPIPSGRLMNLKDNDKWSSLSHWFVFSKGNVRNLRVLPYLNSPTCDITL